MELGQVVRAHVRACEQEVARHDAHDLKVPGFPGNFVDHRDYVADPVCCVSIGSAAALEKEVIDDDEVGVRKDSPVRFLIRHVSRGPFAEKWVCQAREDSRRIR